MIDRATALEARGRLAALAATPPTVEVASTAEQGVRAIDGLLDADQRVSELETHVDRDLIAQVTKRDLALAIAIRHPGTSDAEIARQVGVARQTLCACSTWRAVRRRQRELNDLKSAQRPAGDAAVA